MNPPVEELVLEVLHVCVVNQRGLSLEQPAHVAPPEAFIGGVGVQRGVAVQVVVAVRGNPAAAAATAAVRSVSKRLRRMCWRLLVRVVLCRSCACISPVCTARIAAAIEVTSLWGVSLAAAAAVTFVLFLQLTTRVALPGLSWLPGRRMCTQTTCST
jgi:hypothetical protein